MSKVEDWVLDKTSGVNTAIDLQDKIKYLITNYESPEIDADKLAEILARIIEELK